MFFISPPFGNWFFFKNSKPIVGSFTLEPRPGLLGQIFRTLRYSKENKGWVNKIGLRNEGIDAGIQKYKNCPGSVLSIAILNEEEIPKFVEKIPPNFDFSAVHGLSNELKEKLAAVRPVSLGQASRIDGITPAAISVLMIAIKASKKS